MRDKSFFKWVCLFMFLSLFSVACDDGVTSEHHDMNTETGSDGGKHGGSEGTVSCPSECPNRCDTDGKCLSEETTCPETCLNGCDADGKCLPDDVTCPETCLNGCDDDGACLPDNVTCPEICINGCDDDGACLPDDVTCPETCLNSCDADGACLPDDVTCPETCLNGCDTDGACLPDDETCPETCLNGCDADGACLPDDETCPETCLNGCDADGACLPDDETCPETCLNGCDDDGSCTCSDSCRNGCNADGSCACPDTCPNGCVDNGTCACPDTCQYGCDANGSCNAAPCPSACINGCNADGSCKCPSNCKSGCNASNGTCTCPTACKNGCNADGSCKCPSNCKNGCNANGTCTCPATCKNGCNADGSACACPSSCKTSCNPNGVCCKDNNCKDVCNDDGNCVTCDGGKAITQIRFIKPFTNSAGKTTNISIAEWDLNVSKDDASKRTSDTMTIWVKTSDGTEHKMNDANDKCKPEIALSCKGSAVKGNWNQSKGLLTIHSTTTAGSTTCTASLKNDKHIKDTLRSRSLNFDTLTNLEEKFAGPIKRNETNSTLCDPSDTNVREGVFDPQGFDFIDNNNFYFSRLCDNGKTSEKYEKDIKKDGKDYKMLIPAGTPWRRSFCVHKNNKGDHSYNADPILQVAGAGHAQNITYEKSGSKGYLWFANFGTLSADECVKEKDNTSDKDYKCDQLVHGFQKTRILTRFPLDQMGKYNQSPKELPGTHYYYSEYKQDEKVYNQGIVNLEAAVDNPNNMIAVRGTIQSPKTTRHVWVYKLSNITDNLSTVQTDYPVYIEKTLNSFKASTADIDQGSDGKGRKYTINKSKLKDLSGVAHLNTFSNDAPSAQGITLANGFIFFVNEIICEETNRNDKKKETCAPIIKDNIKVNKPRNNYYISIITTHIYTYTGEKVGSYSITFDSSTLSGETQLLYVNNGEKFNGYVETEGIRYRDGIVYIFAKVRFNGETANLRRAYIFKFNISQ